MALSTSAVAAWRCSSRSTSRLRSAISFFKSGIVEAGFRLAGTLLFDCVRFGTAPPRLQDHSIQGEVTQVALVNGKLIRSKRNSLNDHGFPV
jgi:hypothetical protein